MSIRKSVLFFSSLLILSPLSLFSAEDEDEKARGGIEEVTVTAEKREYSERIDILIFKLL